MAKGVAAERDSAEREKSLDPRFRGDDEQSNSQ